MLIGTPTNKVKAEIKNTFTDSRNKIENILNLI